jgi:hypothetical protein
LVSGRWYFVWRPPWSIWFLFVTCLAIILPKADKEAADLLGLCLLCVTVVNGLTVPALYFGGDALLSLLRAPGPGSYLALVLLFVFVRGAFLALSNRNSRAKHFG